MDFGAELRAARKSAGLSQEAVAKSVGVSSRTIRAVEAGGGRMATITAIMAALNYRVSGLSAGASLAEQIANRRRARRLTQAQLAERANVSVPTVRAAERGHASATTLSAIIKVIARAPRRRAKERPHWEADPSGARDKRFTPPEFLEKVASAFGPIDLDPCANAESFVEARRFIFPEEDGLTARWSGRLVFANPPYSQLLKWVRRAHRAWADGEVETVVALLPVRTDSAAFHELVYGVADVLLLKGRQRFFEPGGKRGHQAPFPLMVVIWGGNAAQVAKFAELVPSTWLPRHRRAAAA